jgi:hypothetical protein
MTASAFQDRKVTRTLPASLWQILFTNHLLFVQDELEREELDAPTRLAYAIQLLTLYGAATEGLPATLDDVQTGSRELLEEMMQRLLGTR